MVDVRSDSNLFDVPPSALHLPSLIGVCLGLEVEGIERLLLSHHTFLLNESSLPFVEEEEADARARAAARGGPLRRRHHRDPVAGALQVALPLQVRVQAVARPLLPTRHLQEVTADPVRPLLLRRGTRRGPQFP